MQAVQTISVKFSTVKGSVMCDVMNYISVKLTKVQWRERAMQQSQIIMQYQNQKFSYKTNIYYHVFFLKIGPSKFLW